MSSICPINRNNLHYLFVEPYLHGARRLNRAWQGVDFEHLSRPNLSLTARSINLLTGLTLMIPVVNTIVYLVWQTFGNPEPLQESFFPARPVQPVLRHNRWASLNGAQLGAVTAIEESQNRTPPTYSFLEQSDSHSTQIDWNINTNGNQTVVTKTSQPSSSVGICTQDGSSMQFHLTEGNYKFSAWLEAPQKIKVLVTNPNESPKETQINLPANLPWIQDPIIGLKEFALSSSNQKKFYIIADRGLRGHTTPYYLEIQATKYGTVDVPGFGSLLKIQVSGTSFPYSMMVSTSWVDPSDGKLCKYELPLNMQKTKTGTLI